MEREENLTALCKSSDHFWAFHYLDLITRTCLINGCLWKRVKLLWGFETVLALVLGTIFALAISLSSVWQNANDVNSTKAALFSWPRSLILFLHPSCYPSNTHAHTHAERSGVERVWLRCPSISRRCVALLRASAGLEQ